MMEDQLLQFWTELNIDSNIYNIYLYKSVCGHFLHHHLHSWSHIGLTSTPVLLLKWLAWDQLDIVF